VAWLWPASQGSASQRISNRTNKKSRFQGGLFEYHRGGSYQNNTRRPTNRKEPRTHEAVRGSLRQTRSGSWVVRLGILGKRAGPYLWHASQRRRQRKEPQPPEVSGAKSRRRWGHIYRLRTPRLGPICIALMSHAIWCRIVCIGPVTSQHGKRNAPVTGLLDWGAYAVHWGIRGDRGVHDNSCTVMPGIPASVIRITLICWSPAHARCR